MINKYPDGSSYAIERNPSGFTTFRINSYEDLWHLNQYVNAYNNFNKGGMRPTITIPNLIDAQADRRFNVGESSGLKLVCEFLNKMNADFRIFHPHNPEVVEALMDNVEIIDNSEFILQILLKIDNSNNIKEIYKPVLKKELYKPINNLILMSSDAGGFKPLMKLCDKISWQGETASASKYRECKNGKSILTQLIAHNDFKGKDILIIDDICVYGGTFKGLSKILKERNSGKLYLAVSHMTVQNLGEDPVTNYFDTVFTTNSKYDQYFTSHGAEDQPKLQNLEIIKMF
jgi:ribose-phosphate pyrophosphokinase